MSSTLSDYLPIITSLQSELSQASQTLATATGADALSVSKQVATLVASITLVSNEQVIQTATAETVIQSASSAIVEASSVLSELYQENNVYGMMPSYGANLFFAILMGIFLAIHTGLSIFFVQSWFGVSYFLGIGLEMAGFIGRALGSHDVVLDTYFLLQIISLTIAPVFIMAGIYYLLAQLIAIYGTEFARLKPMSYSYIFISCDFLSLILQAAGGGIAAGSDDDSSSASGTNIMVGGLVFQVVSMSVFGFLMFDFLMKIRYLKKSQIDIQHRFNPSYELLRSRKLFKWFPLVICFTVLWVYIRCIYRVVELAEGWRGYLITHEIYFMILDAAMMSLTILFYIPFHPGVVYGKHEKVVIEKGEKSKYSRWHLRSKSKDLDQSPLKEEDFSIRNIHMVSREVL